VDSPFEYRKCPNCGEDDFDVLLESNMKDSDFLEGVDTVYMIPGGKYGRHVKCRNCHLIYVNPIEKASKINGAYFQMRNDDASIIRQARLTASESQVRLIKRYGNGGRLLDIGCGEGFFLFGASKAGYATKGIEIAQGAAEYAKGEFGLDVEARAFEELQFPEGYFDVITLWQVLEHMPYPLKVLKEVHRILKPGGLVAASTPDIGGMMARILRRKWWNLRRVHVNQFTAKTLIDMLYHAGFRDLFSTNYKESISVSMLIIPLLKRLGMYESAKGLFYPGAISAKIMNKVTLAYPSRLDTCTVIGFK
jgi:2-polyprenyl-3-methyl-5-hydroxy-6-metoxy-1,4-benzoquinol methylase